MQMNQRVCAKKYTGNTGQYKWGLMRQTGLFRIISLGLTIVLLHGCSWTFVYDISKSTPASEAEQKRRVSQCRENVKSIAPAVDLTAALLQLPGLALGGILLGDKHDGINRMGASLIALSGGMATLFLFSMREGHARQDRCNTIIDSIGVE